MATTQEMLNNVNTAINSLMTGGAVQEYTINGRSLKKYSLDELMKLKDQLKSELRAESGPVRTYVEFGDD
jgi:lipopolysaccharide/colanic/teichoic acid biosynthesis glycosyltransferase